jgi:hypothetical protein
MHASTTVLCVCSDAEGALRKDDVRVAFVEFLIHFPKRSEPQPTIRTKILFVLLWHNGRLETCPEHANGTRKHRNNGRHERFNHTFKFANTSFKEPEAIKKHLLLRCSVRNARGGCLEPQDLLSHSDQLFRKVLEREVYGCAGGRWLEASFEGGLIFTLQLFPLRHINHWVARGK